MQGFWKDSQQVLGRLHDLLYKLNVNVPFSIIVT